MSKEKVLENIEDFMHQLGGGYAFIGREYKLNIGDKKNYIDYLFYLDSLRFSYFYKVFLLFLLSSQPLCYKTNI